MYAEKPDHFFDWAIIEMMLEKSNFQLSEDALNGNFTQNQSINKRRH